MGLSSSLLDESKLNFIKGRAEAVLESFAPIYRKQYLLAFLSHVHNEQVQHKEEHTQLLKQREPPQEADVLYMGKMLYFNDHRKWKQRFAVVRASYTLECHESFESFEKGTPPLYQLLPTGGTIFTTEEKYMEMVNKFFPGTNNVKEEFAPPADALPEDFPVYLRLPYRRDYYFCFPDEDKQADFISILSDCIRHKNQDFLKKKNPEVQAFVKAVQFYRQNEGRYEPWDMLIGSDARVLANLTMESLLPTLEKDLLSRLKAKKTEKKRMWFAAVEETYYLVQQTLMEGLTTLKKECREAGEKHSALVRSNMDQIMTSRAFVEAKLRATVGEAASRYCTERVEPHLPALLEEVMGPISLGFMEAQQLSKGMMERLCQGFQEGVTQEELQQAWEEIRRPDLQSCYEKVSGLKDHMQELQQGFSYPSSERLEQGTQIDIEQLVDNVTYTFELFLHKAKENKRNLADAMEKVKHRVLKQYDYDSSTVRKRIFQEALLNITLPAVKAHLAPTFKNELPTFEQYIFADYVNFINVENVYEDILQQILGGEISKVVNEAASMKKYNLFTDSKFQFSVSSLRSSSLGSMSSSPGHSSPSPALPHANPTSPTLEQLRAQASQGQCQANGSPGVTTRECHGMEERVEEEEVVKHATIPETPTVANSTALSPAENVREVESTNKDLAVASIPTGTPPDLPGSVPTAPVQPLANPILRALETVNSRMQVQSSSTGDTELPNQAAQSNETAISPVPVSMETETATPCSVSSALETTSCDLYRKVTVTAPPTGGENKSNQAAEAETVVGAPTPLVGPDDEVRDLAPSFDVSWIRDNEEVKSTQEGDPGNTEARAEVQAASLAPEGLKPNPSSPPEGSTETQPATRPPDCIKDIRDLVVEVIEVEEMVQRYPDDRET